MKEIIAQKTEKIQKLLIREYLGTLSQSRFFALLKNKEIKINGKRISKNETVNVGDKVVVYFDGEAPKVDKKVIFEDDNVLVCHKPKKVTSEQFFASLKAEYADLYFCHRLDRNTDGVMIFAKNESAYREIYSGFKNKTFEKFYVAEVFGKLDNEKGTLVHYIRKNPQTDGVDIFDTQKADTKKAVLEYNVIETCKDTSKVLIKLQTGRTHQIRAQFAKIGHFVIGDGRYGSRVINEKFSQQLRLSAIKLILHFKSGEMLAYLDNFECKTESDILI